MGNSQVFLHPSSLRHAIGLRNMKRGPSLVGPQNGPAQTRYVKEADIQKGCYPREEMPLHTFLQQRMRNSLWHVFAPALKRLGVQLTGGSLRGAGLLPSSGRVSTCPLPGAVSVKGRIGTAVSSPW